MKKRIVIIFFAALLLLCACQPTPESPIVVGKDNEAMIEKAKETSAPVPVGTALREQLGCPEVFSVSIADEAKKIRITGEAPIMLPDTDAMPLLYVQAGRFGQEQVYAFFRTLTAGQEMYELPTATPKEYIAKHIQEEREQLDQLLADGKGEDDFEVRAYRENIQALEKEYQTAPETVALVPNDGTLKPYEYTFAGKQRGTGTSVLAIGKPFTNEGSWFQVTNDADYADAGSYTFIDEDGNEQSLSPMSSSNLEYARESGHMVGSYTGSTALLDVTGQSETGEAAVLPDGVMITGYLEPETLLLSVTPAEARRQAETLMQECGVTDMFVDGVYLLTDRQHIDPEWWREEDLAELRAKPEQQVYAVRFLRRAEGVPVESYFGASQARTDDSGYGPEWFYEVLEVGVDDGGIQSVYWVAPLTTESVITDHAALLPFSDVRGIFEKMLPVRYANYAADLEWDIEIEEVRLCLWRIFDRNSFTRGILVPAWCFYGRINGDSGTEFQPILIVNAVDGTIIDPLFGY